MTRAALNFKALHCRPRLRRPSLLWIDRGAADIAPAAGNMAR
jgi:hypothetical protein